MKNLFIVVGLVFLVVGCNATENSNNENQGEYMMLEQDKAYEMMQNEDVIIIDVRTLEEYNEGHIDKSNLIPVDVIEDRIEGEFPTKDAIYLVYCRSGNRSETASKIMAGLGYTQVYNIGGINTWPYEIVTD